MLFFITAIRALAACLITNSHYGGIYPDQLMAIGGLLGDVLFFCVSGYCLCHVKGSFPRWYGKRVMRCYVPVILITAIYMLIGYYPKNIHSALWWYIYPTYYHFVASIIILYIPFYVFMKIKWCKQHIPLLMLLIAAVYMLVYLFAYNTAYYHIDTVEEPMIRFLFMESMLLGAHLKQREDKIRNRFSWTTAVMTIVLFATYFVSKILFSRNPTLAPWQIVDQLLIFAFLYFVFRLFIGADEKLERLPSWCKRVISFLAKVTLEIYVVQNYLIYLLYDAAPFPVNWLCVTAAILLSAFALHCVSDWIIRRLEAAIEKLSIRKKSR